MIITKNSITALENLERVASKTIDTILSGDEITPSRYLDQIRLFSATLGYNFNANNYLEENIDLDQKTAQTIKRYTSKITQKLELIEEWCHRYDNEYSYKDLTNSEKGLNYLIDSFLPLSWNFNRDIIFLFSDYSEKLADNLIKRGQKSLIIFSNKKSVHKNIKYVSRKEQVKLAIVDLDVLPKLAVSIEPLDLVSNRDEIAEIYKEIDQTILYFATSQRTYSHFSQDWINKKISNLKYMSRCHTLSELKVNIEHRNVVIVSPGPSLGDDLDNLRKYAKFLIIIAVGQACPILTSHGISPDYVVVVDSQEHTHFLKGLDTSKLKAFIFYDHVHKNFLEIFPEVEKVIISMEGDAISFIDVGFNVKEDITGGSVSVVALKIAVALGAAKIGLMGQDLHLEAGQYYGQTKPKNISVPDDRIFYDNKIYKKIIVKTNSEAEAATNEAYWTYLIEIEALLTRIPHNKVINFSKYGAKIEGAKYKPFFEFCMEIDKLEKIKKTKLNKKNILEINQRKIYIKQKLISLEKVTREFQTKFFKINKELKKEGFSSKVKKIEKELQNLYKLYFFMNIYSQKTLQLFEYTVLSKKGVSNIQKNELKKLYNTLQEDTLRFHKVVRTTLKEVGKGSETI